MRKGYGCRGKIVFGRHRCECNGIVVLLPKGRLARNYENQAEALRSGDTAGREADGVVI